MTFYVYFGFFFVGYLWIFGLLFYRTVNTVSDRSKLPSDPGDPHLPMAKSSDEVGGKGVPSVAVFNLQQVDLSTLDQSRCVTSERTPNFHVCTHDHTQDVGISATIHLQRVWEADVSDAILTELQKFSPDDVVFVDIGANVGWFSLLAAASGYRSLAIDPFADNLALLGHSVELNNCSRLVTAVMAAVSDRRGQNLTFVDKRDNVGGRFSLRSEADRFKFQNFRKLTATTIRLDDLTTVLERFDMGSKSSRHLVLKLDIEGDECRALRTAQKIFDTYIVSAIFAEWEETRKLEDQRCVKDMTTHLSDDLHFRPYTLAGRKIDNLDPADLSLPQNLVWRRLG